MIQGSVEPGFESVRDAFRENFEQHGEIGAAVCAWLEGRKVVDLWGGLACRKPEKPWRKDEMVLVFSVTKGLMALAFLMLADQGRLDYDAPVSAYWPEFQGAGKEAITVRQLFNHRSGLCAIDRKITTEDLRHHPERVHAALVAQAPLWEPGSAQGYGAISLGLYGAELFRRITGESVGRFFAREVAAPLNVDVHIGLPETLEERVARIYPVTIAERLLRTLPEVITGKTPEGRIIRAFLNRNSATARAFSNPGMGPQGFEIFNDPEIHRMELLWVNAIATARGLARVYAALAEGGELDGVRLCSPEILQGPQERQSWGFDRVLHKEMGFSLGFVKEEPHLFSPNEAAFGHPGMGGAVGFADPSRRLAFAYVMNRMDRRLRSPRALRLCHALYRAL